MSSASVRWLTLAVVLSVALAALPVAGWSITDFPQVDCAATDLQHCSQCHYMVYGSVTYYFCAICDDTDSQMYSQATMGSAQGTCVPYDPTKCNVNGCHKCAADDATKCMACDYGVPDVNTQQCLGESISSATDGKYTSTKNPESSSKASSSKGTNPDASSKASSSKGTNPDASSKASSSKGTNPDASSKASSSKGTNPEASSKASSSKGTNPEASSKGSASAESSAAPPTTTTTTTTTEAPCRVPNCNTCSSNSGTSCSICAAGYTIMATGQCMQAGYCSVQNCVQCLSASYTTCSTCVAGYALTTSGTCVRRSSNGAASVAAAGFAVTVAAVVASANLL